MNEPIETLAAEIVENQGDDLSRYQRMFLKQDVERAIRAAMQAAYEDAAQQIETMPVFARPRDCAGIIRNHAKEVTQ